MVPLKATERIICPPLERLVVTWLFVWQLRASLRSIRSVGTDADAMGGDGLVPTAHIRKLIQAHPTPYTLHPTPHTLHPTPVTLRLTPFTLHPAPYTLHTTPFTLHPTPCTLTTWGGLVSSPHSTWLHTRDRVCHVFDPHSGHPSQDCFSRGQGGRGACGGGAQRHWLFERSCLSHS